MDGSDGTVQSRGDRRSNKGAVLAKKGTSKGSDNSIKTNRGNNTTSGTASQEYVPIRERIEGFWYSFDVSVAQLRVFRLFFFLLYALTSFEQLPTTYKIATPTPKYHHFILPHFSFPFAYLPSPTPFFVMGTWFASYFLGVRVAFGIGGQLDVFLLALLKGYTVFITQTDNYQHHYLTVLLLIILAHVPWKSLENSKARSWPIRLLLVQLSIVYFWTAVAKLDTRWTSGEILPRSLGPEFVSYFNSYGSFSWALLSIATIIMELILCVLLQISSRHWLAVLLGVPMHIIMGISGLQIGRFSEMMVAIYLLLFPPKIIEAVNRPFLHINQLVPYKLAATVLLYIFSYVVLKISGAVDVAPVVQFVLLGLFIVEMSEHFSGWKLKSSFPHQLLASLGLIYLCFYTRHLRDAYIQAGTLALPYREMNTCIDYYRQAVTVDPNYAEAYGDLGLFLESVGNHDEAERGYMHVLQKLDKENLKALVGMLRISDNKKDREKICSFVTRSLPIAQKISQRPCVNQECTRGKGHAGYVLQTANNLKNKWGCE